ncbi:Endo-1,4-beta-xylanase A precursor [compost metagenome]
MYAPGRAVSRTEFLKLMMEAFDLVQTGRTSSFTDVKAGQWYADAVSSAQALGIGTGYEDGTFGASRSITREEMAVMAVRIMKAAGMEPQKVREADLFGDASQISAFATEAVNIMAEAGFIEGQGTGDFAPKSQTTRAEASVLAARILGLI